MFRPITWNGGVAMRVELYGCTKGDKRQLFLVFTFNILYMITFFSPLTYSNCMLYARKENAVVAKLE